MRRSALFFIAIVFAALVLRVPRLSQSLWFDEMYTLGHYVAAPWLVVLAARAGEYAPNNHVLHTILLRGWIAVAGDFGEAGYRVPSLVASCLLPVAAAWKLKGRTRVVVAVVIVTHPWLIAFGTEARGYSIMLLLGALATNNIATRGPRGTLCYALAMAGAIYTIPIAAVLVVAHLLALTFTRRSARVVLPRVLAAILLAAALYAPMWEGLLSYYGNPYATTLTRGEFLTALPQFLVAGETVGVIGVFVGILVIAVAIFFTATHSKADDAEVHLASVAYAIATALAVLSAMILPATTEIRFAPWATLWLACAAGTFATRVSPRVATRAIGVVCALLIWRGFMMKPNEPIREAVALADKTLPAGRPLIIAYLGSREAVFFYGSTSSQRQIVAARDRQSFEETEAAIIQQTGHAPAVLVLYPDLMQRRNEKADDDAAGYAAILAAGYHEQNRLSGRVSDVTLWVPNARKATTKLD